MVFTEGGIYKDIYSSGEKGQPPVEDELEKKKNLLSGAEPAVQLPNTKTAIFWDLHSNKRSVITKMSLPTPVPVITYQAT